MAITNTFRDVATAKAKTQAKMIDAVTEEAPILGALPMEPASHGLSNVYEEIVNIDSVQAVDLDEALPEVNAESKLSQVDLRVLGAMITVGEDKAKRFGGAAAYFRQKYGPILKKTGADMERALIYNAFRAYAQRNHTAADPRLIAAGGVSANANYSIVAVHYAPGEINGLYDPTGFGNGKVFDVLALNNGAAYADTNGRIVYGVRLKTYFGMQLANSRYVSSIVNIDGTHVPTAAMLDDLIQNCRGRPENTILYMHPKVKSWLQNIKGGLLEVTSSENGIDRRFMTWNGVAIMDSYNFLQGTEALVTVA